MIDMYRVINAEKVNRDYIIINHTGNRVLYFEIFFVVTIGVLFLIQVLSYNHQDILEFLFTVVLAGTTFLLYKFRRKIWRNSIVFDREKGTVQFNRTIPYLNKSFPFSKMELLEEQRTFEHDHKTSYYNVCLLKEGKQDKKYYVCQISTDIVERIDYPFPRFIRKYMTSDSRTLKNLIEYNREADEELNKPFHL